MILINVKHALLLIVRRVIAMLAFALFATDIMALKTTLAHNVMIFIAGNVLLILLTVLIVGILMA